MGDGNNISFWLDNWTLSGTSLVSITNQINIDTTISVKNVVTPSGDRDYNFITSNLPYTFAFQVIDLQAPKDTEGPGNTAWGGTNTTNFTIQRVYESLNNRDETIEGDWKALWSWKDPHRIQTLMWMAAHERLLTNYRRSKWGVGISATCYGSDKDNETIIYVLRDFPIANQT